MFIVASIFKGITINKKMCLDQELLCSPETRILKWYGYKHYSLINEALSGHPTTIHYFELLKNTDMINFISIR